MKNQASRDPSSRKRQSDDDGEGTAYARFASLSGQIVVTMLAGLGLGYVLDKYIPMHFPVFKFACSIGAIFVVLYLIIRQGNKN